MSSIQFAMIKRHIAGINQFATSGAVGAAQTGLTTLLSYGQPTLQLELVELTPSVVDGTNVLRYTISTGQATHFFGVVCPEAAQIIMYNHASEAEVASAYAAGIADLAHTPIEQDGEIYFEIWQAAHRIYTAKTGFKALIGTLHA
jgi:hypothetical protein